MKRVREKEATLPVTTDIDARARELLTDLDRAERCNTKMIDSRILHMAYQRFPVDELKEALESNLNRLLIMQIREREKGTKPKEEREDEVDAEDLGYVRMFTREVLVVVHSARTPVRESRAIDCQLLHKRFQAKCRTAEPLRRYWAPDTGRTTSAQGTQRASEAHGRGQRQGATGGSR